MRRAITPGSGQDTRRRRESSQPANRESVVLQHVASVERGDMEAATESLSHLLSYITRGMHEDVLARANGPVCVLSAVFRFPTSEKIFRMAVHYLRAFLESCSVSVGAGQDCCPQSCAGTSTQRSEALASLVDYISEALEDEQRYTSLRFFILLAEAVSSAKAVLPFVHSFVPNILTSFYFEKVSQNIDTCSQTFNTLTLRELNRIQDAPEDSDASTNSGATLASSLSLDEDTYVTAKKHTSNYLDADDAASEISSARSILSTFAETAFGDSSPMHDDASAMPTGEGADGEHTGHTSIMTGPLRRHSSSKRLGRLGGFPSSPQRSAYSSMTTPPLPHPPSRDPQKRFSAHLEPRGGFAGDGDGERDGERDEESSQGSVGTRREDDFEDISELMDPDFGSGGDEALPPRRPDGKDDPPFSTNTLPPILPKEGDFGFRTAVRVGSSPGDLWRNADAAADATADGDGRPGGAEDIAEGLRYSKHKIGHECISSVTSLLAPLTSLGNPRPGSGSGLGSGSGSGSGLLLDEAGSLGRSTLGAQEAGARSVTAKPVVAPGGALTPILVDAARETERLLGSHPDGPPAVASLPAAIQPPMTSKASAQKPLWKPVRQVEAPTSAKGPHAARRDSLGGKRGSSRLIPNSKSANQLSRTTDLRSGSDIAVEGLPSARFSVLGVQGSSAATIAISARHGRASADARSLDLRPVTAGSLPGDLADALPTSSNRGSLDLPPSLAQGLHPADESNLGMAPAVSLLSSRTDHTSMLLSFSDDHATVRTEDTADSRAFHGHIPLLPRPSQERPGSSLSKDVLKSLNTQFVPPLAASSGGPSSAQVEPVPLAAQPAPHAQDAHDAQDARDSQYPPAHDDSAWSTPRNNAFRGDKHGWPPADGPDQREQALSEGPPTSRRLGRKRERRADAGPLCLAPETIQRRPSFVPTLVFAQKTLLQAQLQRPLSGKHNPDVLSHVSGATGLSLPIGGKHSARSTAHTRPGTRHGISLDVHKKPREDADDEGYNEEDEVFRLHLVLIEQRRRGLVNLSETAHRIGEYLLMRDYPILDIYKADDAAPPEPPEDPGDPGSPGAAGPADAGEAQSAPMSVPNMSAYLHDMALPLSAPGARDAATDSGGKRLRAAFLLHDVRSRINEWFLAKDTRELADYTFDFAVLRIYVAKLLHRNELYFAVEDVVRIGVSLVLYTCLTYAPRLTASLLPSLALDMMADLISLRNSKKGFVPASVLALTKVLGEVTSIRLADLRQDWGSLLFAANDFVRLQLNLVELSGGGAPLDAYGDPYGAGADGGAGADRAQDPDARASCDMPDSAPDYMSTDGGRRFGGSLDTADPGLSTAASQRHPTLVERREVVLPDDMYILQRLEFQRRNYISDFYALGQRLRDLVLIPNSLSGNDDIMTYLAVVVDRLAMSRGNQLVRSAAIELFLPPALKILGLLNRKRIRSRLHYINISDKLLQLLDYMAGHCDGISVPQALGSADPSSANMDALMQAVIVFNPSVTAWLRKYCYLIFLNSRVKTELSGLYLNRKQCYESFEAYKVHITKHVIAMCNLYLRCILKVSQQKELFPNTLEKGVLVPLGGGASPLNSTRGLSPGLDGALDTGRMMASFCGGMESLNPDGGAQGVQGLQGSQGLQSLSGLSGTAFGGLNLKTDLRTRVGGTIVRTTRYANLREHDLPHGVEELHSFNIAGNFHKLPPALLLAMNTLNLERMGIPTRSITETPQHYILGRLRVLPEELPRIRQIAAWSFLFDYDTGVFPQYLLMARNALFGRQAKEKRRPLMATGTGVGAGSAGSAAAGGAGGGDGDRAWARSSDASHGNGAVEHNLRLLDEVSKSQGEATNTRASLLWVLRALGAYYNLPSVERYVKPSDIRKIITFHYNMFLKLFKEGAADYYRMSSDPAQRVSMLDLANANLEIIIGFARMNVEAVRRYIHELRIVRFIILQLGLEADVHEGRHAKRQVRSWSDYVAERETYTAPAPVPALVPVPVPVSAARPASDAQGPAKPASVVPALGIGAGAGAGAGAGKGMALPGLKGLGSPGLVLATKGGAGDEATRERYKYVPAESSTEDTLDFGFDESARAEKPKPRAARPNSSVFQPTVPSLSIASKGPSKASSRASGKSSSKSSSKGSAKAPPGFKLRIPAKGSPVVGGRYNASGGGAASASESDSCDGFEAALKSKLPAGAGADAAAGASGRSTPALKLPLSAKRVQGAQQPNAHAKARAQGQGQNHGELEQSTDSSDDGWGAAATRLGVTFPTQVPDGRPRSARRSESQASRGSTGRKRPRVAMPLLALKGVLPTKQTAPEIATAQSLKDSASDQARPPPRGGLSVLESMANKDILNPKFHILIHNRVLQDFEKNLKEMSIRVGDAAQTRDAAAKAPAAVEEVSRLPREALSDKKARTRAGKIRKALDRGKSVPPEDAAFLAEWNELLRADAEANPGTAVDAGGGGGGAAGAAALCTPKAAARHRLQSAASPVPRVADALSPAAAPAAEAAAPDAAGAGTGAGDADAETARYVAEERAQRPVYIHAGLHVSVVKLLLYLMVAKDTQTLDPLYTAQFPLNHGLMNGPWILHHHLNDRANAFVVLRLIAQDLPDACRRILKLLSRSLFDVSLYPIRDRARFRLIAQGAFGSVYAGSVSLSSAQNTSTAMFMTPVAVKVQTLAANSYDRCVLHDIFNEITIMERLANYEGISRMYDYGVTADGYVIVMHNYTTSLKELRLRLFEPPEALTADYPVRYLPGHHNPMVRYGHELSYMKYIRIFLLLYIDFLRHLQFLHDHGVNHFDLKADNIFVSPATVNWYILMGNPRPGQSYAQLMTKDFLESFFARYTSMSVDGHQPLKLAIADFGESMVFCDEESSYTLINKGTEYSKSPEMLLAANVMVQARSGFDRRRPRGAGPASDVWSAACCLYELLTGDILFFDSDWIRFYIRVTSDTFEAKHVPPENYASNSWTFGGARQFAHFVRGIKLSPEKRAMLGNCRPIIDLLEFTLVPSADKRPRIPDVIAMTSYILDIYFPPAYEFAYGAAYSEPTRGRLFACSGFHFSLAGALNDIMANPMEVLAPKLSVIIQTAGDDGEGAGGDGSMPSTQSAPGGGPGGGAGSTPTATAPCSPAMSTVSGSKLRPAGRVSPFQAYLPRLTDVADGILWLGPVAALGCVEDLNLMNIKTALDCTVRGMEPGTVFQTAMERTPMRYYRLPYQLITIVKSHRPESLGGERSLGTVLTVDKKAFQEYVIALEMVFDIIRGTVSHGGRVLVYDEHGDNLAAAVAIAFLMEFRGLSIYAALLHLAHLRLSLSPPHAFLDFLHFWSDNRAKTGFKLKHVMGDPRIKGLVQSPIVAQLLNTRVSMCRYQCLCGKTFFCVRPGTRPQFCMCNCSYSPQQRVLLADGSRFGIATCPTRSCRSVLNLLYTNYGVRMAKILWVFSLEEDVVSNWNRTTDSITNITNPYDDEAMATVGQAVVSMRDLGFLTLDDMRAPLFRLPLKDGWDIHYCVTCGLVTHAVRQLDKTGTKFALAIVGNFSPK